MVRWSLALALVGCSFEPGSFVLDARTNGDGSTSDGRGLDANVPDAPPAEIAFVQSATAVNAGNNGTVTVSFDTAQTKGNLVVVVVSWDEAMRDVSVIGDTLLHQYLSATAKLTNNVNFSQRVFYATNVKAGTNYITAFMTNMVSNPRIRIFEYSGLATALPVDKVAFATGTDALPTVAPVMTTQPRELLFSATVAAAAVIGPGVGYTQRQNDARGIAQDRVVTAAGSYGATVSLATASPWIAHLVTFKGAN